VTQTRWQRRLGDTAPPITDTLRELPMAGQRVGTPVDLGNVGSVMAVIRRWPDRAIVHQAVATVVNPGIDGNITLPTPMAVTAVPGLYEISWFTAWPNGTERTFPQGDPAWLLVAAHLDVPGPEMPAHAGPTLFAGDGATVSVTANNQVVFAGSGVTINVAPDVTAFWVAEREDATPWLLATVPTVMQGGTTMHPTAGFTLLNNGGGLTLLARDQTGTVWLAASPGGAGAANQEIGHGSVLPVDGSAFQLFDLEAHAVLPNGLYRWDNQASVWVQD
jgi:hypothetical protein